MERSYGWKYYNKRELQQIERDGKELSLRTMEKDFLYNSSMLHYDCSTSFNN